MENKSCAPQFMIYVLQGAKCINIKTLVLH